jgi:hypothetical protein
MLRLRFRRPAVVKQRRATLTTKFRGGLSLEAAFQASLHNDFLCECYRQRFVLALCDGKMYVASKKLFK